MPKIPNGSRVYIKGFAVYDEKSNSFILSEIEEGYHDGLHIQFDLENKPYTEEDDF